MTRHVFFSFHYQRDIFRVNQIRHLPTIQGEAAAGFRDGSLWEAAKRMGDAEIKRLINNGLHGTSVTVVCIGAETAGRKYVNYEIEQSLARGNGVIGLRINHLVGHTKLPDQAGVVPQLLTSKNASVFTYTNPQMLANWIEQAARTSGH